jgi:threonyl-tRNA synthetase
MKISLPDGSIKEFEGSVTGHQVAMSISEGLARAAVAVAVDGEQRDGSRAIEKDAAVRILTLRDEEGLEIYRHSSAHIMALAVKRLYPDVKLAIGPVIENGFYYDFDNVSLKNEDFEAIEKEMQKIVGEKLTFERSVLSKAEALSLFKDEPYKVELINDLPEEETITCYRIGEFVDLCRGPHLPNTGMLKAFKLLRLAGAYWRGDSKNKMLTRVYATSFGDKKAMNEYLEARRKAEENDHVKLGRELDLFITNKHIGQGLPLFTPRGTVMMRTLQRFIETEEYNRGYDATITPFMAKSDLYKISGHWQHYKDGMFIMGEEKQEAANLPPGATVEDGEEVMALRPMTCPFQFMLYKRTRHSYRELPIRYSETSTLFRNESSGEMHGLTRVRQFTLSEGHIICTPEQVKQEFHDVLKLISYVMETLDLTDYTYRFSKWDPKKTEKYIDNPIAWESSQKALKEILDENGLTYTEADGEAAFYGPKLDIQMKNVWGKEDTIITVQIDFALPGRFEMTYIDSNGEEKAPMVIHRSSIGCYERTLALLIERFGGKFPFWLSPDQIVVLTINETFDPFAEELVRKLKREGFRAYLDNRNETLKRKVRDAQVGYIPAIVTIGAREQENKEVSVRTLDGKVTSLSIDAFIAKCSELTKTFAKQTVY